MQFCLPTTMGVSSHQFDKAERIQYPSALGYAEWTRNKKLPLMWFQNYGDFICTNCLNASEVTNAKH